MAKWSVKISSVKAVTAKTEAEAIEKAIQEDIDSPDRDYSAELLTARAPARKRGPAPEEHIAWTIAELESWRETFDNEGDEPGYEEIGRLVKHLEAGTATKKDLENVLFHLWQQKGQEG